MKVHGESSISCHQFQFAYLLARCKNCGILMKSEEDLGHCNKVQGSKLNTLSLHDTFL